MQDRFDRCRGICAKSEIVLRLLGSEMQQSLSWGMRLQRKSCDEDLYMPDF